jgi:glycosyltransferase involved in cell wall biosynthesis
MAVKVLYLIPRLEPGGAAKQLTLLAGGLPRNRFEPCVCALGRDGPFAEPLRKAGVRVEALGWHRAFDPGPLWQLTRLIREFRPDVVHAWQPLALRVAALPPMSRGRRLFVSAPFDRGKPPNPIDRWLLRRANGVIVFSGREAELCRRARVPESKVAQVALAVVGDASAPADLGLPAGARCIAGVGPLEPTKGFRDAVWAFDILRQVVDDLRLVLIGEGSDRPRLQEFARNSQMNHLVHLLGPRDDVPAVLARAELVWVPSRTAGGLNAALEGQAAGRPVIASRLPELSEIVADGETGFLVAPGDKATLARQSRRLLDNAAQRGQMGDAARRRVQDRFSVAELVRRCAALYE